MKRLSSALLAVGLLAASTTAFAQSGYDNRYGNDRYDTQGYGNQGEAHYDYARVIRVAPAIDGGYGGYDDSRTSSYSNQRCISITTSAGGIMASTAVAMTMFQSVAASPPLIMRLMPITTGYMVSSVVTSSGHRYWFQP